MFVKEIVYTNKEDSEEDVIVSDGHYAIKCYMYPVENVSVNSKIDMIYGFGCTDIMKMQSEKYEVIKLPSYYTYRIYARVMRKNEKIICVGGLKIKIDAAIPNDICDGDYIKVFVMRFDCG